ncbi:MAG: hypothetical protein ACJ76N_12020 [Thermoanaerobaculia bacterium]
MSHPNLRRALAVLALTFATAFAAAPEAGAAVCSPRAGTAHVRTAQQARGSRLREALTQILRKAGIQIDPWGLADVLVQILPDDRG